MASIKIGHPLNNKEYVEELVDTKVIWWATELVCKIGDNLASSIQSIKVITQSGEERSFIFKQLPTNAAEWIIAGELFPREISIYRTIAPKLQEFAHFHGFSYTPPFPNFYKGHSDNNNDYLLLEDLRASGFKMPDKRESLNYEEVTLVLKELAKLHAVSSAFLMKQESNNPNKAGDFKYLIRKKIEGPDSFDSMIQTYFEAVTVVMETVNPQTSLWMKKIVDSAWKIRKDAEKDEKYFQAIVHVDLWINNLLMKYDEDKVAIDVKFIDFQFTAIGNIFTDLQFFFFTSTDKEFREKFLRTCLIQYHDEFTRTLGFMKCPRPQGFDQQFLIDEFNKWHLSGFIQMTSAIPLQLGDVAGCKLQDEIKTRSDKDALKAKISQQLLQSPLALRRLLDLAEEVMQLNLI